MLGNLLNQRKTPRAPEPQKVSTAQGTTPQPSQSLSPNIFGSNMNPSMRQDMSALSHLDQRSIQVLTHAQEEAKSIKQATIEPDQILLGLLYDQEVFDLLEQFSVDVAKLQQEIQTKQSQGTFLGQPTLSDSAKTLFDQAYKDAKARSASFVSPEDILMAIFNANLQPATYLEQQGVKKEQVVEKLSKSTTYATGKKSVLDKYGIDLTAEAKEGRLDPVAGRDKEVERLVHILLRRTKNNPIIIGEAGVGKTAVIEGLAQQIVGGKVPSELQNKRIIQLDISSLVAGASHRGEFEERLRNVINEAMASSGQIVLFIDEIHTVMGAGSDGSGAMDASNIIKPHLARGHLQVIGTTTTAEYRKYFEKDKAFERRFQPIICEEPSEEIAIEMLKVLRPKYEKFHNVTISDEAIDAAVKLSKKYIGERYLPDKGVDLLDEASAEVKLRLAGHSMAKVAESTDTEEHKEDAASEQKMAEAPPPPSGNSVQREDIEMVVSSWTGIPITKLTEDEGQKLLKLEDRIHERLVDQEEAVKAVAEAVRRGRIGLASANRPIASFIFLGPTGVGKTELAKTVAEILFGKDEAMVRLDMSEYMEKHEVAKLIGAPPGYVGYEEGGQLTEAVRIKPYSIVLLDEVEKAHPDVFNILLQLLEDGRLTDNKGNTISFKNTIIVATSNIASGIIQQKLSQQDTKTQKTPEQEQKEFEELSDGVIEELRKFFRPELLNRFDDIVIFKPLRKQDMDQIVTLGIKKTAKLLEEQGYHLQAAPNAVKQLAQDGYDPVYGARPLRRLIQMVIENPIALHIISKTFVQGDTIVVDYDATKTEFTFTKGSTTQSGQVPAPAGIAGSTIAQQGKLEANSGQGITPQSGLADNTGGPQPSENTDAIKLPSDPKVEVTLDPYALPQQPQFDPSQFLTPAQNGQTNADPNASSPQTNGIATAGLNGTAMQPQKN